MPASAIRNAGRRTMVRFTRGRRRHRITDHLARPGSESSAELPTGKGGLAPAQSHTEFACVQNLLPLRGPSRQHDIGNGQPPDRAELPVERFNNSRAGAHRRPVGVQDSGPSMIRDDIKAHVPGARLKLSLAGPLARMPLGLRRKRKQTRRVMDEERKTACKSRKVRRIRKGAERAQQEGHDKGECQRRHFAAVGAMKT